jgi:hypothetical protein
MTTRRERPREGETGGVSGRHLIYSSDSDPSFSAMPMHEHLSVPDYSGPALPARAPVSLARRSSLHAEMQMQCHPCAVPRPLEERTIFLPSCGSYWAVTVPVQPVRCALLLPPSLSRARAFTLTSSASQLPPYRACEHDTDRASCQPSYLHTAGEAPCTYVLYGRRARCSVVVVVVVY